jgi:hypothetical protein
MSHSLSTGIQYGAARNGATCNPPTHRYTIREKVLNVAHSSNENKEGSTITKTMDQAANESAPSENGEIQQNTLRPRVLSVSSDEVNYLIYRYVSRS